MDSNNKNKTDDYNKYKIFKILGENIKSVRLAKNITIKILSERTGIRAEYIRKIENGKAYGITLTKHVFYIAKALNVKPSELVKGC